MRILSKQVVRALNVIFYIRVTPINTRKMIMNGANVNGDVVDKILHLCKKTGIIGNHRGRNSTFFLKAALSDVYVQDIYDLFHPRNKEILCEEAATLEQFLSNRLAKTSLESLIAEEAE